MVYTFRLLCAEDVFTVRKLVVLSLPSLYEIHETISVYSQYYRQH